VGSKHTFAPALATLLLSCRPHGLPAATIDAGPSGSCGALDCREFDSLEAAFDFALVSKPLLVAVGEAHAQKGTTVPSSAKHFTEHVLPMLKGRASDILVELMNPPEGCAKTTEVVRQKQEVVTRSQAKTDQGEYVALGERARALGIVPDLLRPTCADMDAVKAAGEDAVTASLELIAHLSQAQATRLLDRDARTPGDQDKMVLIYGGAIHNDLHPPEARAAWSFAPALDAYTHGRLVTVEIFIPELFDDSESWKARSFYKHYDPARMGGRTTVFRDEKTFVIVLPRGGKD
jgi:hypothetical protein